MATKRGFLMASGFNRNVTGHTKSAGLTYDVGLREYFLKVYNYMGLGLGFTGLISYFIASSPMILQALYGNSAFSILLMLAPLGVVFYMQFRLQSLSLSQLQTLFWIFSGLMGLSLAPVFLVYTGTSIARVFFITAGTFGAMSLYGYTTKKDLSAWGSFLFMGLIGLIIGGLVNLFLQSSGFQFLLSAAGVIVFTGLTAYDTQMIKEIYDSSDDHETYGKKAIIGALSLYMDFINLFLSLLRLLGDRR